jgi:hypothetical protein
MSANFFSIRGKLLYLSPTHESRVLIIQELLRNDVESSLYSCCLQRGKRNVVLRLPTVVEAKRYTASIKYTPYWLR